MSQEAFNLDCMYCHRTLHCPADKVGRRIKCPGCGSAMMADPARKSSAEFTLPDVKPAEPEERDDTEI